MKKTFLVMLLALSVLLCGCTASPKVLDTTPTVEPAPLPTVSFAAEIAYAPDAVTDLVAATLYYYPENDWDAERPFEQTTDAVALATLADLLKNAYALEYTPGCFHTGKDVALTLTRADGMVLRASLALDSCSVIQGGDAYYNFEPIPYRDTGNHPGNKILYALFGVERN